MLPLRIDQYLHFDILIFFVVEIVSIPSEYPLKNTISASGETYFSILFYRNASCQYHKFVSASLSTYSKYQEDKCKWFQDALAIWQKFFRLKAMKSRNIRKSTKAIKWCYLILSKWWKHGQSVYIAVHAVGMTDSFKSYNIYFAIGSFATSANVSAQIPLKRNVAGCTDTLVFDFQYLNGHEWLMELCSILDLQLHQ